MQPGGLAGVFAGGALPWLEAVVVVPVGILSGLDPVAVVLAGLAGNLLTVAVAAYAGARLRAWWLARRGRERPSARAGARSSARRERSQRVFARWGMPGRATAWVGAGTVLWCVVAAVLAVDGSTLLGGGG
ncbi:small multi-drug export protein [Kineococcus sp. SYSU DK004]|uniref:small multi-drug export protein n=1 Tax=Kineococcus sp. SYSU DK004 TaxID=3383125 RepID=UPI003D7CF22C